MSNMTQKIAFFPGVYETIYKGQIDFAKRVKRQYGFDKVVFVLHNKEPYVDKKKLPSVQARFNTLNKAIQPFKYLDSLGIEFKPKNNRVHMYHLVKFLKETYKLDKVNILMGSERLKSKFYKWDKIHHHADFFILPTINDYRKNIHIVERNNWASKYYALKSNLLDMLTKPNPTKIVAKTMDDTTGSIHNLSSEDLSQGIKSLRNTDAMPHSKNVLNDKDAGSAFVKDKQYYKDIPKAVKFYVRNTDVVL